MDKEYTELFWNYLREGRYVSQAYNLIVVQKPPERYMTWHSSPGHGQYVCPHAVVLPLNP